MLTEIRLLNGSSIREKDLGETARLIREIFAAPVTIGSATLDFGCGFDASRRQVNSTVLLAQILTDCGGPARKQVAVVDVDLFIPVLTFVFGEAQLEGCAAVVSTHRLSNQFYGLARNDLLMRERLAKEIVHELGHTCGLYHCRQFECVMRSSTYVEEIDLKRVYPCAACAEFLHSLPRG